MQGEVEKEEKLLRKRGSVRHRSDISSADVLMASAALTKRGTVSGAHGAVTGTRLSSNSPAFRPTRGWRCESVRVHAEAALLLPSNRVCADCSAHLTTKYVHQTVRVGLYLRKERASEKREGEREREKVCVCVGGLTVFTTPITNQVHACEKPGHCTLP
jgi:rRNA maturation endonuclease Nob1